MNGAAAKRKQNSNGTTSTIKDEPGSASGYKKLLYYGGFATVAIIIYNNPLYAKAGQNIQNKWDSLLDTVGDDPYNLFVWGTLYWTIFLYWGYGALYTFMDIYNVPKFLRKYKVQPGTHEPVDMKKLYKLFVVTLFNQVAISIPFMIYSYKFMEWRGGIPDVRTLPTLPVVIFNVACAIMSYEFGFYYTHRMFHHKSIYKYVHKVHHEWTAPISVAALYCHPLEHVVANLIPLTLGTLIFNPHIFSIYVWGFLAITGTLNDHSGYHFPFMQSPEFHDFHHLKFNYCFGSLGIMDRLHNTDTLFRETVVSKRHKILNSLKSARELEPDKPKRK